MRKPGQKYEDVVLSRQEPRRWGMAIFLAIAAVVMTWGAVHRRGLDMSVLTALAHGLNVLTYCISPRHLPRWCQEPAFHYINWLAITFCWFAVLAPELPLAICVGLSAFLVVMINTIHRRRADQEAREAAELRALEIQWAREDSDRDGTSR
ncbi:hypothetical protein ACIBG8_43045 [Nonomuraea sp. NPDC050556]|uniref:hypothetical protein n=1 Tax=Nonomuraea sp. NPDC050556 TaxID=3364369 RepID=UPI00378AE5AC